jgi:hypothetical protein
MRRLITLAVVAPLGVAALGYFIIAWMIRQLEDIVQPADFELWDEHLDWLFEGEWDEPVTKDKTTLNGVVEFQSLEATDAFQRHHQDAIDKHMKSLGYLKHVTPGGRSYYWDPMAFSTNPWAS